MKSTNYNNFGTMASAGSSVESPHGTVHVYVGGAYGHMSWLSYSAFDPILYVPSSTAYLSSSPLSLHPYNQSQI